MDGKEMKTFISGSSVNERTPWLCPYHREQVTGCSNQTGLSDKCERKKSMMTIDRKTTMQS